MNKKCDFSISDEFPRYVINKKLFSIRWIFISLRLYEQNIFSIVQNLQKNSNMDLSLADSISLFFFWIEVHLQ